MPKKAKKIKQAPPVDLNQITLKDERFYQDGDIFWPRVTWITSFYPMPEGLKRFLGNAESYEKAEEEKEAGGLRGKNVHQGIQDLIAGQKLLYSDFSKTEWKMLESFFKWQQDVKPKFLATEQLVLSNDFNYGGRFDCLAEIAGVIYLIDWKTSKVIGNNFWGQISAYIQALFEADKDRAIIVPAVLRLGTRHKNKGYEFVLGEKKWEEYFRDFLAARHFWEIEHKDTKPNNEIISKTLSL